MNQTGGSALENACVFGLKVWRTCRVVIMQPSKPAAQGRFQGPLPKADSKPYTIFRPFSQNKSSGNYTTLKGLFLSYLRIRGQNFLLTGRTGICGPNPMTCTNATSLSLNEADEFCSRLSIARSHPGSRNCTSVQPTDFVGRSRAS